MTFTSTRNNKVVHKIYNYYIIFMFYFCGDLEKLKLIYI